MSAEDEIGQLEDLIIRKIPLSPGAWLEHIGRVVVMMGEQHDKLWTLDQQVSKLRVELIEKGDSVAMAKEKVRAMDIYREFKRQESYCHRLEELVRIGKLMSRLKEGEWGGGSL